MKILIADDYEGIRELNRDLFKNAGFQVETAENGAEAFNLFRKAFQNDKFDVVLTDMEMPDINGAQLAQLISTFEINSKIERKKMTPVIIYTGNMNVFEGAFAVIPKNLLTLKLTNLVNALIK